MLFVRRYSKYFVVGGVVGLLTVGAREVIARLLPGDNPAFYVASVSMAYLLGILMSYVGHRLISFRGSRAVGGTAVSLMTFSMIALVGLGFTASLSALLRYGIPLERQLGSLEPTIAFAFATFLSSFVTYGLNARFTFASAEVDG